MHSGAIKFGNLAGRSGSGIILTVLLALALMNMPSPAADNAGRYADLPGVKLWFTDTGGGGVPIVLLHANTGTSAVWERQAAAFSEAGYRVIAFDRRGWGRSTAAPESGPQPGSIAGDLDALADHLKLDRFHLSGLPAAASRPSIMRHGGRSDCAASWWPRVRDNFPSRRCASSWRGSKFRPAPATRGLSRSRPRLSRRQPRRHQALDRDRRARPAAGRPSQPLRTPNTFAKLAEVTMPTLVMAADCDLLAPPALMRLWAAHLKDHDWAVIGKSGHSIAWNSRNNSMPRCLISLGGIE